MNIVNLYQLNGNIFKIIYYIDINNLKEILNNILEEYNTDSFIQLILNNTIINIGKEENNFNFYIINNLESDLNNDDFIQVIFVCKKLLFIEYINNDFYLLNKKYKNDKYYKIIKYLIGTNKYKFIINSTYRDIVLDSVKYYGYTLEHVNNYFKNDKSLRQSFLKPFKPLRESGVLASASTSSLPYNKSSELTPRTLNKNF